MNTNISKKQIIIFLIVAFTGGWILQAIASVFANQGTLTGRSVFGILTIVNMFMPTLGVLIAGISFKKMGWRPQIKKNLKWIAFSMWMPALLSLVGALLYFAIFPTHLDLSFETLRQSLGQEGMAQMQAQGVSYPLYVLISTVGSVTYAPLINTVVALGEELGWRGFLYPQLKARFGRKTGRLLGGVIWGAWHWPLIWLTGYEYGAAYFGFPVVGMLLFCFITVGWGILHDRLYEISGSIWVPALFHGAINAAATLPAAICLTDTGSARLLGPAPNGLLAGLPFLIAAAVVFFRKREQ